jgi:NADH-quinone oxidoreductase subunit N
MTREGAGAVLLYLVVYLFMNLGAFAVVAMIRNLTGHEDITYLRGFVYRSPLLVIMLGVFMMSLLGMPPLGGFTAKFQIFTVLFDAAQEYAAHDKPHLSWTMYAVLLAGGINTVISLFYYVKVLKVMILEKTLEQVEDRPVETRPAPIGYAIYATFLAVIVLLLGILWDPLAQASSKQGVDAFRPIPSLNPPPPGPVLTPGPGAPKDKKGGDKKGKAKGGK